MVKTSRYLHIGPGGCNCACCFTAPRSKDRRKQFRIAKRKAEREAMRQAEADMIDHWATLEDEVADQYKEAYGEDGWPHDCDDDDYDDEIDYSIQEKVARALSTSLIGDDSFWRAYLENAKRFMEAMRNA